jgi:hypothetical protein
MNRITGNDQEDVLYLWQHLADFFLEREIFKSENAEKIKAHFIINKVFRKPLHLWNNVEKRDGAREATHDNIIRRMRFACWITKTTGTHSKYVTLIAFPRQKFLRELAPILHYTYSVSLIYGNF